MEKEQRLLCQKVHEKRRCGVVAGREVIGLHEGGSYSLFFLVLF